MKKILDLRVVRAEHPAPRYALLTFTPADGSELPAMAPGQFAQVQSTALLRRPISICDYSPADNTMRMLIAAAGEATHRLVESREGDVYNVVLPLGRGFEPTASAPVLVGGGVGVAPLLLLARKFAEGGVRPRILLGARSKELVLLADEFARFGQVFVATDDGTAGHHGLVTEHPLWEELPGDSTVYCCGPAPMMKAVARRSRSLGLECMVSLENMMACGLGACLCCVEKTVRGNVCVCTEGPVFNINELTW